MRIQSNNATSSAAVSAIKYDWSTAFKLRGPASPTTMAQYDWSGVFAKVKAQRDVTAPPAGEVSEVTVVAPRRSQAKMTMSRETWALLSRVNEDVNRSIIPQSDMATYGVADYWAEPLQSGIRYGDCEDYVLEKRHALAAAGVPLSAMSIAVVLTYSDETHAVLVVATSAGDYVLDNRTPWILPWKQTDYRWRERQVAGSASHWAFAAVGPQPQREPHASALITGAL